MLFSYIVPRIITNRDSGTLCRKPENAHQVGRILYITKIIIIVVIIITAVIAPIITNIILKQCFLFHNQYISSDS